MGDEGDDERRLGNFLALIADGEAPASVLGAIREIEQSIKAKRAELARLTIAKPSELDARRMKKQLRERAEEFENLMRSDVPVARQALRELLEGQIALTR